jgi:hypothetical protein
MQLVRAAASSQQQGVAAGDEFIDNGSQRLIVFSQSPDAEEPRA